MPFNKEEDGQKAMATFVNGFPWFVIGCILCAKIGKADECDNENGYVELGPWEAWHGATGVVSISEGIILMLCFAGIFIDQLKSVVDGVLFGMVKYIAVSCETFLVICAIWGLVEFVFKDSPSTGDCGDLKSMNVGIIIFVFARAILLCSAYLFFVQDSRDSFVSQLISLTGSSGGATKIKRKKKKKKKKTTKGKSKKKAARDLESQK